MRYRTVKSKAEVVIEALKSIKSEYFELCPTIKVSSLNNEFDGLDPADIENVLRFLDGQEECIRYSSTKRYKNPGDCRHCRDYQEVYDMLSVVPVGHENEVYQQLHNMLDCLDFEITFLSDFDKGAKNVAENIHAPGKNAVRLFFDDMDRPHVEVCDTGLSACVCPKIRGAAPLALIQRMKIDDPTPFSATELTETPNHYGNGMLLRRTFGEPFIYKPFCKFNGDYGKISVSLVAAHNRLKEIGVKISQIEDFLRKKKYGLE